MPRRRRKSSPFSLFSFQDIVTSVTAVIILITLILTLDLVTRQPSSAASQLDESVTDLQSAIRQAEDEKHALEIRIQHETAIALGHATFTPEQLKRDLEQCKVQVDRLRREVEQLRLRQSAIKQYEDAALARSLESTTQRKELDVLAKRVAAAQNERKQVADGNQLIFNRPPGTSKRPWLVDTSADLIVVLPFDLGGDRFEFHDKPLSSCAKQMVAWTHANCSSEKDYFVLLVRPSGIENADSIRNALLKRGFDIGRDIIGPNQKVTPRNVSSP